ncbi:MAG: tetratricopeptide repeat protein [Woeseiaceae bacterium]
MGTLWKELRRRNVVRVGIAYAIVAWIALQVIDFALEIISAPHWILQLCAVLAAIGLPGVLIFAWVYEMTPEGLKRESEVDRSQSIAPLTGRKLDRVIMGVLALAVVTLGALQLIGYDGSEPSRVAGDSGPASIAVLPFEDFSEEKDQEYFSKGIAEEILNLLAKTNALRVAARTSSFAFAGQDADIRDIGNKLDVATVLEGSIRKSGPTIRITAQLIDVDSGYHLWSETYDRDYTDIFKIQDEIAASIIDSLRVHLLGDEPGLIVSERAANVDAYSAFLIGRERMALRTREDLEAARSQFEDALAIDSSFAPAHVYLAHSWLLLEQERFRGGDLDHADVDAVVDRHLARAIELAPNLPEAVAVTGYHHLRRYRFDEAAAAFDRAIELNPNYALAYAWRADTAYEQGRYLDMLSDKEHAYALDPMSLEISADLAYEYRSFGRPTDAERVIKRMFDLHPDHALAYEAALDNFDAMGHESEAALLAEKAIAAHPDDEDFRLWRAYMLLEMGLYDEAIAVGVDEASFWSYMESGRVDQARSILDTHLAKDEPGLRWLSNARLYYDRTEGSSAQPKIAELMAKSIEIMDATNRPWRSRCSPYMVYGLRIAGYDEDAETVMDVCRTRFEQRLEAKYLCPCEWYGLIRYTILDGDYALAIERTKKWLDDGDSAAFFASNSTIHELASHPDFPGLLERNNAEVARERQYYLANTLSENRLE